MHQKKNLSNLSKSAKGSASSGRVLLMASLRFGQSKEHVPADGTRVGS